MEQAQILQAMLDQAREHNLEMECLISLINNITDPFFTDEDLRQACEESLLAWDV